MWIDTLLLITMYQNYVEKLPDYINVDIKNTDNVKLGTDKVLLPMW